MFLAFANWTGIPDQAAAANAIFQLDSRDIAQDINAAWEVGARGVQPPPAPPLGIMAAAPTSLGGNPLITWDHLIYAYMIENSPGVRNLPPRGLGAAARRAHGTALGPDDPPVAAHH